MLVDGVVLMLVGGVVLMLVGGAVGALVGAFLNVDTGVLVCHPMIWLCKSSVVVWVWPSEGSSTLGVIIRIGCVGVPSWAI